MMSSSNRIHPIAVCALLMVLTAGASRCHSDSLPITPPVPLGTEILLLNTSNEQRAESRPEVTSVCPTAASIGSVNMPVPATGSLALPASSANGDAVTLTYSLPSARPGVYDVWTAFAASGVAEQSFQLSAGNAPPIQRRAAWTQTTDKPWTLAWRKAGAGVVLFPREMSLSIDFRGLSTGAKEIRAIALVRVADLPSGMDDFASRLRAGVLAWQTKEPMRRAYVLESDNAASANPLFESLQQVPPPLKANTRVDIICGADAHRIAEGVGIELLPAVVVMDDRYMVMGIEQGANDATQTTALLSATTPAQSAFSIGQQTHGLASKAIEIKNGVPQAWLTCGTWSGLGGLSLAGLHAEEIVRPVLGNPVTVTDFDAAAPTQWKSSEARSNGITVLDPSTNDFDKYRGAAYACLYLNSAYPQQIMLHSRQTGVQTLAWLDNTSLAFQADIGASSQNVPMEGSSVPNEGPVETTLPLTGGWNRLLIKLVTRQSKGETLSLAAKLTGAGGGPLHNVTACLCDPTTPLPKQASAARLQPLITTVNQPFNLVSPGTPITLHVVLQPLTNAREATPVMPVLPQRALADLTVRDYDGVQVATRRIDSLFPGSVDVPLGVALPAGYYSVELTLSTTMGQPLMRYAPDGFSVIGGNLAQTVRTVAKKMAVAYDFVKGREEQKALEFPYMERIGIRRAIGAAPGPDAALCREAQRRGLLLSGELWDYADDAKTAASVAADAPYVDSFKAFSELDLAAKVRESPARWTGIAKMHYDAVKAVSPSARVLSARAARPGEDKWLQQCLSLGMDKYVDAWDVRCAPRIPPVLGGSLSDNPAEGDLAVQQAYMALGKTNTKPFWVGEAAVHASYGLDSRRWQADTVAKMTACADSRPDVQAIAFPTPWRYSRQNGTCSDTEAGHMPAEAAYYTASALIDGFPYKPLASPNKNIQVGQFGPTTMVWSTDKPDVVPFQLGKKISWVLVDVVGRCKNLTAGPNGMTQLTVSTSPIYVLPADQYRLLTQFAPVYTPAPPINRPAPKKTKRPAPAPRIRYYTPRVRTNSTVLHAPAL
ncbi:MAG: hypothetical protein P4L33_09540 [Capsulimonadaceae bacterium]|nr:hypothetical protein [Capsulimonadaceae bacterium]